MKIFVNYIMVFFGALFLSLAVAKNLSTDQSSSMLFQVNHEQVVFNNSTVESATLIPVDDATDQYGVSLKLKNDAAAKLSELTAKNIGKQSRITLNGVLISSPTIQSKIGAEFLVVGLTKIQAQQFVKSIASH
ncbi:MAG: preprotein translocase subunit SecD [Gammaproteobacteria bacterium]|nr:preprotein translocase subunit SecD [Gammaproteobacteria bacterium]